MNDTAEAKLALLRDRFAQSLPRRLDAVEAALPGDPAELERLLHSLAGTSGTYGFTAISNLARLGEECYAERGVVQRILTELRLAAPAPPGPAAEVASPAVEHPSARILCLEDDPDQAAYVCAVLQGANYETRVAYDVGE